VSGTLFNPTQTVVPISNKAVELRKKYGSHFSW